MPPIEMSVPSINLYQGGNLCVFEVTQRTSFGKEEFRFSVNRITAIKLVEKLQQFIGNKLVGDVPNPTAELKPAHIRSKSGQEKEE